MLEDVHALTGRRMRDPAHRVRWILVRPTVVATGQGRAASHMRLARAREGMDETRRCNGRPPLQTREKVTAHAGAIAAKRLLTACLPG